MRRQCGRRGLQHVGSEVPQDLGSDRPAQREIAAARQRDTEAIAAALDAGRKRPARQEEARATKAAEEAAEELEVAAERLKRASERVDEAVGAGLEEWVVAVEGAWTAADARALEAVGELRAALGERNAALAMRRYVRGLAGPGSRVQALARPPGDAGTGAISGYLGANGEPVPAEGLLSAIEAHVRTTGLETVRAGEEEQRARREREAQIQADRDEETREREEAEAARMAHPAGPQQVGR
jgi:hypothetical protein